MQGRAFGPQFTSTFEFRLVGIEPINIVGSVNFLNTMGRAENAGAERSWLSWSKFRFNLCMSENGGGLPGCDA